LGTQDFARQGMIQHHIHQMATFVPNLISFLPKNISDEFPTYACLLGNILEIGGYALSQPDCSFDMVSLLILHCAIFYQYSMFDIFHVSPFITYLGLR